MLNSFPEVEGTIFSYPSLGKKEQEFLEKYTAQYGAPGGPTADDAYDAVYLLKEIIEDVGTEPDAMTVALDGITFSGINTFAFENGQAVKKAHDIFIIEDGKMVLVE